MGKVDDLFRRLHATLVHDNHHVSGPGRPSQTSAKDSTELSCIRLEKAGLCMSITVDKWRLLHRACVALNACASEGSASG